MVSAKRLARANLAIAFDQAIISGIVLPLDYTPMPPLWRRRRFRRCLFGACAVIIIACGWWFGPVEYDRLGVMYWEHRCMTFSPPPGTVVYQILLAGSKVAIPGGYVDASSPEIPQPTIMVNYAARPFPPTTTDFSFAPRCWARLLRASKIPSTFQPDDPVVFCHERRSPVGKRRLVIVGADAHLACNVPNANPPFLRTYVYDLHGVVMWRSDTSGFFCDYFPDFGPRLIEAGQPDAADAAHFTIAYQWTDGVRDTINGWLQDDDSVKFSIRPALVMAIRQRSGIPSDDKNRASESNPLHFPPHAAYAIHAGWNTNLSR